MQHGRAGKTSALSCPPSCAGSAPLLTKPGMVSWAASSGGRKWSVPLNVAVPSRRDNDKNLKRPWREASFTEGACLCAMDSSTNSHFQSIIGCSVSSQRQDPVSRWCEYERGLRNMVPCRFIRGDPCHRHRPGRGDASWGDYNGVDATGPERLPGTIRRDEPAHLRDRV